MTIFLPRISSPSALSSSRVAITVPLPVAASRPQDPCRYTGLPVTTAGEKPAEKMATKIWFSTLNDHVRLLLTQLQ